MVSVVLHGPFVIDHACEGERVDYKGIANRTSGGYRGSNARSRVIVTWGPVTFPFSEPNRSNTVRAPPTRKSISSIEDWRRCCGSQSITKGLHGQITTHQITIQGLASRHSGTGCSPRQHVARSFVHTSTTVPLLSRPCIWPFVIDQSRNEGD